MRVKRSAYEILGITRAATYAEIRMAYRAIVRRAHPDQAGSDAATHERFLEIKAAYDVLIDPTTRAAHDIDPFTTLEAQLTMELRKAQLLRRKRRLRRLYE